MSLTMVIMLLATQTDTTDCLLVTATVPVADSYGWTAFLAVAKKQTLQIVNASTGAVTFVDIRKISRSDASQVLHCV